MRGVNGARGAFTTGTPGLQVGLRADEGLAVHQPQRVALAAKGEWAKKVEHPEEKGGDGRKSEHTICIKLAFFSVVIYRNKTQNLFDT